MVATPAGWLRLALGWLALFLLACHEAPRDNPFDPFLTPAVDLQVALDDTSGTATLAWTPYAGQEPFVRYLVLRRIAERTRVDTLAVLRAAAQSSFVDSSLAPNTAYGYRVSVVNAGGFEVPSQEEFIRPLTLPPVQLIDAQFNSRSASANLRWTSYRGPRFRAYQVLRRTAEDSQPRLVGELLDSTATAFVDSHLAGNTEYFYQVAVQTQRGEEVASTELSGIFHRWVDSWSLAITSKDYVRLYTEPGDQIELLVANTAQVLLFRFDSQGQLLERQILLEQPPAGFQPRTAAMALGPEGQHYLSLSTQDAAMVLELTPALSPARRQELFADSLARLTGGQATVEGTITLQGSHTLWDNVRVYRDRWELFADDFEDSDLSNWDFVNRLAVVSQGRLRVVGTAGRVAEKSNQTWQDFGLEADVVLLRQGQGAISIGSSSFSSAFTLTVTEYRQRVELTWTFIPSPGSNLKSQRSSFSRPFLLLTGVPYRLSLAAVGGRVSTAVQSPVLWSGARGERSRWGSLAAAGKSLVLVEGDLPYTLSSEGLAVPQRALEGQASELRMWNWESSWGASLSSLWLGICVPERNQVFVRRTGLSNQSQVYWPATFYSSLGLGSGQETGDFLFPLSLGAGPDERVYVLDAGNARVQVFDSSGLYLTTWGRKGSAPGEFNFGSGRVPEDFSGSIAVDSQGFIYVADVGNRRIQKFAP